MIKDAQGVRLIEELLVNPVQFEKSPKTYQLLQEYFKGFPKHSLKPLLAHPNRNVQRTACALLRAYKGDFDVVIKVVEGDGGFLFGNYTASMIDIQDIERVPSGLESLSTQSVLAHEVFEQYLKQVRFPNDVTPEMIASLEALAKNPFFLFLAQKMLEELNARYLKAHETTQKTIDHAMTGFVIRRDKHLVNREHTVAYFGFEYSIDFSEGSRLKKEAIKLVEVEVLNIEVVEEEAEEK